MTALVNQVPQLGQPWSAVYSPVQALLYGVNGNAFGQQFVNSEGKLLTYRSAIRGLVLVATPTLVGNLVGAAGVITSLRRIILSGAAATASQIIPADVNVYSTAASAGTATQPAVVKAKSTDAAAAAVFNAYTANPTVGTLTGTIATGPVSCGLVTAAVIGDKTIFDFGVRNDKPPQIVGIAQTIGIHLAGVTLANATTLNIMLEWTEEPTT